MKNNLEAYFEKCREEHYKQRYSRGLLVVYAMISGMPQFGKIMKYESGVLHLQLYETLYFEEIMHCFVLNVTTNINQVNVSRLKCDRPITLYELDKLYAVLPYKLLE